jgi:hypothetical protein
MPLVGLNPFREQRKTVIDLILVIGFVALITGFVLWGFFGQ